MNLKKILKLLIIPVIGILIMIGPIAWFIMSAIHPSLLTTKAPGTAPFEITEPGTYGVWRQLAGVVDSEFQTAEESMPEGLSIRIENADTGETVALEETLGMTATAGGTSRASLFEAQLQPGQYKLVSEAPEPITLLVRKSEVGFTDFLLVMLCFIFGVLILISGIIYAIISIIRGEFKNPKPQPAQPPTAEP